MLKIVLGLFVVVGIASGASIGRGDVTTEKREIIGLLRFETDKKPDGSFTFSYEGADQSFRQESGVVENAGTEDEALEVSGSYRYIDADGNLVEVHYTAGKNGFVPVGTNILSEISAVAKAAADLPKLNEEQDLEEKLNQRRARSKPEQEQKEKKQELKQDKKQPEKLVQKQEKQQVEKVVPKREHKAQPQVQAAATQAIPVQIVLEKSDKAVKSDKVEKSDKAVKSDKAEKSDKAASKNHK